MSVASQAPIADSQLPRAFVAHTHGREAREILQALRALMALQRPPGLEAHGKFGHSRKWKWRGAIAARLNIHQETLKKWWNGTSRPNETNLQRLRALLEAERGVAA